MGITALISCDSKQGVHIVHHVTVNISTFRLLYTAEKIYWWIGIWFYIPFSQVACTQQKFHISKETCALYEIS